MYLAHKNPPTSLGPPYGPRRTPTAGSWERVVSYERGTPVGIDRALPEERLLEGDDLALSTLETTQGQMHGFLSQLPYRYNLEEVASAGD